MIKKVNCHFKKVFSSICIIFSCSSVHSQVTIGDASKPVEGALLQLKSSDDTLENATKGLGLPRVSLLSLTSLSPCAEPNEANNLSHTGLLVYNVNGTNGLSKGLYVWSGSEWVKVNSDQIKSHWYVWNTSDPATSNTDNIYQLGSVAIGTSTPDPSAILDISSSNKGLLGPRVALSSITDVETIANPGLGLIVFNTGSGGLKYSGYVYWDGSLWRSFTSGNLNEGTLGAIICNSVSFTPSRYKAGEYYEGTLIIPYTGGNGGTYDGLTLGPVNGLTATLSSGNFNTGAGNLAFVVTGYPTVTTPETTAFSFTIGGQSCTAVVGADDGVAPGDLSFYKTEALIPANIGGGGANGTINTNWLSYYESNLPILGGKLRLDGYFTAAVNGSGTVSFNPRLVNISDSNVKFWFSAMTTVDRFNTANLVLKPGTWVNLDNGIYNGYGINNTMTAPSDGNVTGVGSNNTEIVTLDVSLDDKWYRVYYYPIVNNNNQTNIANMTRTVFLSIQRLY